MIKSLCVAKPKLCVAKAEMCVAEPKLCVAKAKVCVQCTQYFCYDQVPKANTQLDAAAAF